MGDSGRFGSRAAEEPREVEGKLVVYSERPERTMDRLAALSSLGPYKLEERPPARIRDVYLDTPDGALRAQHAALRVRDLDGTRLLALKADTEDEDDDEDDVVDRMEMESTWSNQALRRVLEELDRRGIRLAASPGASDPIEALSDAGLIPFQDRETVRIPRDVLDPESGPEPVAELAMDTVRFLPAGGSVRWNEIEVEAKGTGDAALVHAVLAALREAAPGELRPWPYPKIATGMALRRLDEEGRLADLVEADGVLSLEAYPIIADVLREESASSA